MSSATHGSTPHYFVPSPSSHPVMASIGLFFVILGASQWINGHSWGMDFRQGFTLWRELGAGHDGANISFQALTAIHYVHRLTAYLVFAVFLALAFFLHRVPAFRAPARWLAGLIVLQAVTGISNAVLGWPLLAAVMHTGGAAALVIVLSGVVFSGRGEPQRHMRQN